MKKYPKAEICDDDSPEWKADNFARARPASAVLRGHPKMPVTKKSAKIWLDADVLAKLRTTGDG